MKFDDAFAAPNFAPSWNIAPTQQMLTTVPDPVTMRWGLIPSWAKDEQGDDRGQRYDRVRRVRWQDRRERDVHQ
jgi:putative SOS response-associated peptidase YedK